MDAPVEEELGCFCGQVSSMFDLEGIGRKRGKTHTTLVIWDFTPSSLVVFTSWNSVKKGVGVSFDDITHHRRGGERSFYLVQRRLRNLNGNF